MTEPAHQMIAALDLGSTSFHMVVARLENGQPQVVDRLRERVFLAAGLNKKGRLTGRARKRALTCLRLFGQRVQSLPADAVRAVGTNTLRRARNAEQFLEQAEATLGHPIEVIAGLEEARLIYLGVAQSLETSETSRRLVIDIGGGSTECILGEQFDTTLADSLYMGCVSYTMTYFPEGQIDVRSWRKAQIAAGLEMQSIVGHYRALGWDVCIGSSGTIRAVLRTLQEAGWTNRAITAKGLRKLRKAMLAAGHIDELDLPGVDADRARVLPGGVAILQAIFQGLGIERMLASPGALREGLLYDLAGRIRHEDVRHRTIRAFMQRYQVDTEQAERVQRTALQLLDQVADEWELSSPRVRDFLGWATLIHEIGLSVAYSGHHRHGAYLVENAVLPGFSNRDKALLATLVLTHRGKFKRARFEGQKSRTIRMAILGRLAVRLNRSRDHSQADQISLRARGRQATLIVPEGWTAANPLTVADLEREADALEQMGYQLSLETND